MQGRSMLNVSFAATKHLDSLKVINSLNENDTCQGIKVSDGGYSRIMIVGTPRSGTTLVQSLFATQSQFYAFPESHFFTGTAKILSANSALIYRAPERFVANFLQSLGLPASILTGSEFGWKARVLSMVKPEVLATFMLDVIDRIALSEGNKQRWIEKTPRHLHYVNWVKKDIRNRKVGFVHVFRDKARNVHSLHKASIAWGRVYSMRQASKMWDEDITRHATYLGRTGHVFVRYEDVVENPERAMTVAFEKLGLTFDPARLSHRAEVSKTLIRRDEIWKENNTLNEIKFHAPTENGLMDTHISSHVQRKLEQLIEVAR